MEQTNEGLWFNKVLVVVLRIIMAAFVGYFGQEPELLIESSSSHFLCSAPSEGNNEDFCHGLGLVLPLDQPDFCSCEIS